MLNYQRVTGGAILVRIPDPGSSCDSWDPSGSEAATAMMRPALSWTLPSTWENWENWGSTSQPTILPGKNGTKMYKTLYELEKTCM